MQGSNKSRGEFSPLATQLQQAWLQSQIPKVQKRRLSNIPAQTRVSSSHFPEPLDDGYLSSIVPRFASHQTVVEQPSAFLEGCDSTGFPERPVLPMLSSYSTKTSNFTARRAPEPGTPPVRNIDPQFLPSTSIVEGLISEFWGVSSQRRSVLCTANIFPPRSSEQRASDAFLAEAARTVPYLDSMTAVSSSSREAEPLPTLVDSILMDDIMEVKKSTDTSYQVMAKEIADLIGDVCVPETSCTESSSNSLEICDYDNSWIEEILGFPEKSEDHTANGLTREYITGLHAIVADASSVFTSVNTNLSGNGMDSSSEYMYEVLNVNRYLEREAQAPARIDYGQSLPQLEHGGIPSDGKRWFEAINGVDFPRVDLADLLLRCAKMVEQNDVRKANNLIGQLRQHSSAYGNGVQRMAYYFVEALAARLSGTGGRLYAAICSNCPPPSVLLKANCLYVDNVPYTKINHLFSNMTILDAFKGASSLHVIDYGISHGIQWQCLIQHLATRPEGPPHLRITGIDQLQPGFNSSERVLETGRRLTEFAKMWRVPFEYHAFAEKWENITTAQLALRRDEVLAVNCFKLHYLLDESVKAESPRKIVLNRIRSLKPKVFVQGVVSAGYNVPFFMSRFRECVKHYSTMFDSLEGSLPPDDPDRVLLEQECFGKEILNIVACEGLERVERAEPYRQWQSRTQRAGFTQRPLNSTIMSKMKAMMDSYSKEFGIGEDGGWILTGWKNHIIYGLSSWEPNLVATTTTTP